MRPRHISIVVILFFAPTLSGLPTAVLSAIVVHAVWGLIDIPAIRRYRASRRIDLVAACVAAVGVLVAGPLLGLLLAVGMSILGLVYRSSRVTIDVMGKVPGEKAAWGALENHEERITLPGILILRLNESLFWVNAARVHDQVSPWPKPTPTLEQSCSIWRAPTSWRSPAPTCSAC